MKNLSLYHEIFEEVDGEVEELGKDADKNKLKSFSLKFETKIPNLDRMCYIMEKVLLNKGEGATVYAGFQKQSRAEAIWDRYHEMADNVDQIYVFGENDANLDPHPNIELINLPPRHELVREWFLVIDKPIGKSMMVAYDLDGFGKHKNEKDRNFKGAKTLKPAAVTKAVELLEDLI
ncbi:MAG: DICT sensory domain-containing protein [Bacillota bacterium]